MKKVVLLTASAALGLTALAAPAAQAQAKPGSIAWHKCSADLVDYAKSFPSLAKASVQCATIKVPLDYKKPRGKKIPIALTRVKHVGKKAKFRGSLLVNPGGPGGTGTDYAIRVAGGATAKLLSAYDYVGFDPRGTGGSTPISCDAKFFNPVRPDYTPKSDADEKAWLGKAKNYAEACGKKYPDLLGHLKTTDSVRDMDAIRARLGEKKLNFLGASYGTYLGGVYATMFPRKVGRFVLDSAVQPSKVWYDANLEQDKAFDRNINIFFKWVAKHDKTFKLGTDAKAISDLYYATYDRLNKNPIKVALDKKKPKDLTVVDGPAYTDFFLTAGYRASTAVWGSRAAVLVASKKGDDKTIAENAGGLYDDAGYPVYLGVQCTDVQWPKDWNKWRADNSELHKTAPFQTWGNAWYNAPCLYWPAKAGKPVQIKAKPGLPDILVFQATLDAATPYAGGPEMRDLLGGKLIVEDGGLTHGVVNRGNAKLDAYYENFLLYGKLPKKDVVHVPSLGEPAAPAAEGRTAAVIDWIYGPRG